MSEQLKNDDGIILEHAWQYVCEACDGHNFVRDEIVSHTELRSAGMPENQIREETWFRTPTTVTCKHCGAKRPVADVDTGSCVGEDEEDDDDYYEDDEDAG